MSDKDMNEAFNKFWNNELTQACGDNMPRKDFAKMFFEQGTIHAARSGWVSMSEFPQNLPDKTIVIIQGAAQGDPQTYCRNFGAWFAEDETEYHDEEFGDTGYFMIIPQPPSQAKGDG